MYGWCKLHGPEWICCGTCSRRRWFCAMREGFMTFPLRSGPYRRVWPRRSIFRSMRLTCGARQRLDANRLAKLKPGALLVNAARGAIVDTDALLDALNGKKIRAAIDVTDPEPLPLGHPLWKAPNLLITPHVAGDSAKFMKRVLTMASQQVVRFVRGQPLLNVVSG